MIKLHFLPIKKFKTFTVSINIHRPLNKEDATKNALLSNVLRRGCNWISYFSSNCTNI